jgi:hypothetical protein
MTTKPGTVSNRSSTAQPMLDVAQGPEELRLLASWYRELAERAGNPVIWESRLLMAESLEMEATRIENELARFGGES